MPKPGSTPLLGTSAILLVALAPATVLAQEAATTNRTVSVVAGLNVSGYTITSALDTGVDLGYPKFGLRFGGMFELRQSEMISLVAGATFSGKGAVGDMAGTSVSQSNNYLEFPLLARFHSGISFADGMADKPIANMSSVQKNILPLCARP